MTNVRMKAVDTLHISSVSADHMLAGTEFDVPTYTADDLEARGLATRVEQKAQQAPSNKMQRQPANKSKD